MSGIHAPRLTIAIDGAPSALAALVTALTVNLRSPTPNASAEIEIGDNGGTAVLPRQDAALRIAIERSSGGAVDIFSGRVTVAGARTEIDGDYFVDRVIHRFSLAAGFSTELTVRRSQP